MKTYKLFRLENGNICVDNLSPMYPVEFEEKINLLAGEKITTLGPVIDGFSGFINTFSISKDKWGIFCEKVLPRIGYKVEGNLNNTVVEIWDKDSKVEANAI